MILDLIDKDGADNILGNADDNFEPQPSTFQNSDLIKGNANVPAPYNTEFTLDNNDGLLIIERTTTTFGGETYQIQGVQIMQSANGLTGNAINLNGATGARRQHRTSTPDGLGPDR